MKTTDFLDQSGIPYQVIPHKRTYNAQRMAQSVHVSGYNVAKTVLIRADGRFKHLVLVVPATKHVDLERVSRVLGCAKVEFATEPEIGALCSDCEFGIVPIFGSRYGIDTLVDRSIAGQDDIYFQGDTHDQTIRIWYEDFCRLELPMVADIIDRNREGVLVT